MSELTINVAIIGLSQHVEKNYLSYLLGRNDINICAICDIPSKNLQIKKLVSDIQIFNSLEQMLNTCIIDAVVISTPSKYHGQHIESCLEVGIDVFVDKPMALSTEEARKLIEKSALSRKILYVALPRRHSELDRVFQKFIDLNELGRLSELHFDYFRPHYPDFIDSWRNIENYGGGVLFDAGYHIVDLLLRYIQSPGEIRDCYLQKCNMNVEMRARVLVEFQNGLFSSLNLSLMSPRNIVSENILMLGSKGALSYSRAKIGNSTEEHMLLHVTPREIMNLQIGNNQYLDKEPLKEFLAMKMSKEYKNPYLETELRIIDFIEKAYEAARFQ